MLGDTFTWNGLFLLPRAAALTTILVRGMRRDKYIPSIYVCKDQKLRSFLRLLRAQRQLRPFIRLINTHDVMKHNLQQFFPWKRTVRDRSAPRGSLELLLSLPWAFRTFRILPSRCCTPCTRGGRPVEPSCRHTQCWRDNRESMTRREAVETGYHFPGAESGLYLSYFIFHLMISLQRGHRLVS